MPKALKKRPVKKTRPDQEETYENIKEAIAKKRRALIAAGAAAVAVLVLAGGIYFYIGNRNQKASELNYQGYNLYYGLYSNQQLPKDQRLQQALEKFKGAYDTKKSAYSLFYVGSIQYDMGKYADSIKTFSDLVNEFPDDVRLVPLANYKIAMASLMMGKQQDALKYLDAMQKYKSDSLKDLALYESARIYDAIGNKEEAERQMGTLRQNFPSSPFLANAAGPVNAPAPGAPQTKAFTAAPPKSGK